MERLNDCLNSEAGNWLKDNKHSLAYIARRAFRGIRGNLFCTGVALLLTPGPGERPSAGGATRHSCSPRPGLQRVVLLCYRVPSRRHMDVGPVPGEWALSLPGLHSDLWSGLWTGRGEHFSGLSCVPREGARAFSLSCSGRQVKE